LLTIVILAPNINVSPKKVRKTKKVVKKKNKTTKQARKQEKA